MVSQRGALAQLGARHIRIVEVVSSNLICSRQPEILYFQGFPAFLCAPGSLHFWKIALENTGIPRSEEFLAHKFENPVSVQAVPGDCTNKNFRCEILSAARTEMFNVKFRVAFFCTYGIQDGIISV